MADFADIFPENIVLDVLGDTISYNGIDIKVIFSKDVEKIGDDGYTVELQSEIEVLLVDLASYPVKNDVVIFKSVAYKVTHIERDTGIHATLGLLKG